MAEQARAHELDVYVPSAPNERQARRELDIYLTVWQVSNPGIAAYVIDGKEHSAGR